MLSQLKIENVAVIEKADISFGGGLNILTGETGAGKSIVIDSINAILGERTSKDIIRSGQSSAKVSAFFEHVSPNVKNALAELELECEDDGSLLITRTIASDGRSACRVNGQTVTVSMLRQLGRELITICGQHDSQHLLQKDKHLGYVDYISCLKDDIEEYKSLFNVIKEKKKELDSLLLSNEDKLQRLEFLRFQINEIECADITIGEKERLLAEKKRISEKEKLFSLLYSAEAIVNGDENNSGVSTAINNLCDVFDGLCAFDDKFRDLSRSFKNLSYELDDCRSLISKEIASLDEDETNPDDIEERLDIIYRLSRKYGGGEEEILSYYENALKEMKAIEFADEYEEKLSDEIEILYEKLCEKARYISSVRKKCATAFEMKVKNELSYLDMPSAQFVVSFKETKPSSNGIDDVEFLFSANSGQELRPLNKIASGGELSRTMLAIKCVLSDAERVDTMIFDEIDTGVSGRAAQKIAYKMKQLSSKRQILCVTHLAQIAAAADNHLLIEKSTTEGNTYTEVRRLVDDERINEIARIIGGDVITKTTLMSACELIDFANKP